MKQACVHAQVWISGAAIVLSCSSVAMAGDAAEPASLVRLGAAGQIVLSSDLAFSMTYTSLSAPTSSAHRDSIVTLVIGPAADYFLSTNISVGGTAQFIFIKQGSQDTTGLGIAPRVGVLFPMSDKLSFWPKVSLGYFQTSTPNVVATTASTSLSNDPPADNGSLTHKVVQAGIFAPVTYELAPHFFVGLGPTLTIDLWAKEGRSSVDKATTFGIASVVGGYF